MSALALIVVAYLVVLAGGLLLAMSLCRAAARSFCDDDEVALPPRVHVVSARRGRPRATADLLELEPVWDWPQT